METTTKSTEPQKVPIYPPDKNRAIIYWIASFAAFCAAAAFHDLYLTILTGIAMASASAYVGEQLYKVNVYKEILYYRALWTMIDVKDMNDKDV